MTQRELMLAKLRERPGEVVPMRELEEAVFAGCLRWPQFPHQQLASIASKIRQTGPHVELVQGAGYRLIEN